MKIEKFLLILQMESFNNLWKTKKNVIFLSWQNRKGGEWGLQHPLISPGLSEQRRGGLVSPSLLSKVKAIIQAAAEVWWWRLSALTLRSWVRWEAGQTQNTCLCPENPGMLVGWAELEARTMWKWEKRWWQSVLPVHKHKWENWENLLNTSTTDKKCFTGSCGLFLPETLTSLKCEIPFHNVYKEIVRHFANHTYSGSYRELDEKLDTAHFRLL